MVKKIFKLLSRRQKFYGVLLLILMIGRAAVEVVGIAAIPIFVGLLSDSQAVLSYPFVQDLYALLAPTSPNEFVIWAGVVLVMVFLIKNTYVAGFSYVQAYYVNRVYASLSVNLFRAYLDAPFEFHISRNSSELLRNVSRETSYVGQLMLLSVFTICTEAVVSVAVMSVLVVSAPLVSLVATTTLGLSSLLFFRLARRRTEELGKTEQEERSRTIQVINEGLGGIKELKILGKEGSFTDSLFVSTTNMVRAARYITVLNGLTRPYIETVGVLGILLISIMLLSGTSDSSSIIPFLSLFAAATLRLMPSFNQILSSINNIRYYSNSVDVVTADFRLLKEMGDPSNQRLAAYTEHRRSSQSSLIELCNVSYRYPGSASYALDDVSLSIPRGSSVAFVGPSGAGKTTVIDVLLGLLRPESGQVLVDGVSIQNDIRSWQSKLGYIPQTIYLTDGTVRQNVAFGVGEAAISPERVERAVRAAQLDEFISSLPRGLETVVGERGVRLSGGQRQRVAIARALYHDPRVLVMDEATAALDNETERQLVQAIEELRGDRTVLMIAHRLSSVRNCDLIVLMKEGRIEAVGSYRELLETSGVFRTLASVDVPA